MIRTVADVMASELVTFRPDTHIRQAIRTQLRHTRAEQVAAAGD